MKPTVLILCTGNSCRSQIAAGILRAAAGQELNVQSAAVFRRVRDEIRHVFEAYAPAVATRQKPLSPYEQNQRVVPLRA